MLKHGLDPSYAASLFEGAARGLDLATEDGCDNAYGGKLWIGDVKRRAKRAIMRTCKAEAARIAAAMDGHAEHPEHVFAEAQAAHERIEAVFEEQLSPDQRRRIAMMTEHGDHGGTGGDHAGH